MENPIKETSTKIIKGVELLYHNEWEISRTTHTLERPQRWKLKFTIEEVLSCCGIDGIHGFQFYYWKEYKIRDHTWSDFSLTPDKDCLTDEDWDIVFTWIKEYLDGLEIHGLGIFPIYEEPAISTKHMNKLYDWLCSQGEVVHQFTSLSTDNTLRLVKFTPLKDQ